MEHESRYLNQKVSNMSIDIEKVNKLLEEDKKLNEDSGLSIIKNIEFNFKEGKKQLTSLIDTGAEMSLLPRSLLKSINFNETGKTRKIQNYTGEESEEKQLIYTEISIPSISKPTEFLFAVSENTVGNMPIIGMNILKQLDIVINTKAHDLYILK